jgi:hypothetical protein
MVVPATFVCQNYTHASEMFVVCWFIGVMQYFDSSHLWIPCISQNLHYFTANQPRHFFGNPFILEVLSQLLPKLREVAPSLVMHRYEL